MPIFLLVFLLFSGFSQAGALDLPFSQISDDSLLRIRLKDSWLKESPGRVLATRPIIETLASGEKVEVRAMEGRDEFMVVLSREMMSGRAAVDGLPGVPRVGTGSFPGYAQGSWMLIRRKDTGTAQFIRIFLRSDQYTYIQFRPYNDEKISGEKCLMDAVFYGGFVTRSLPIPVSFERLYTMPLNDVLKLAGDKFPRKYFDPDPVYYRDTRKFIAQVRARIGNLNYEDDGAIDENGNYVFIENLQRQTAKPGLNCSGFAKWLIDGLLRPVTGKRLTIPPLKAPFGERGSSFTALWEESRDPFFGLDWIRNLASEANGVLRSAPYRALDEFEVRTDTFSYVLVNENRTFVTHTYPGFLPEAGYGVEGLHPLLYTLAIDDPFSFYLAAANTEFGAPITPANLRGAPRLRQYYHIAALVPYFDEYGAFRIVVFESASETSFNGFRGRHQGRYVNLVRIPIPTAFDP